MFYFYLWTPAKVVQNNNTALNWMFSEVSRIIERNNPKATQTELTEIRFLFRVSRLVERSICWWGEKIVQNYFSSHSILWSFSCTSVAQIFKSRIFLWDLTLKCGNCLKKLTKIRKIVWRCRKTFFFFDKS